MSDTANNRQRLLARWSELAPGECSYYGGGSCVLLGHFAIETTEPPADSTDAAHIHSAAIDRAIVLSALIEAIRARGWHYQIESNNTKHIAFVVRRTRVVADEPCDALLSAYVAALEATKEKK